MTGQLFLPGWEIEPCDTAPAPASPMSLPDLRNLTRLDDSDLGAAYKQLRAALSGTAWPDENHTRANLATQLGHVEREMQRRDIWWSHQPDTTPTNPAPRPRTRAADRLRELRERRLEPEAGRAAGGPRLWTPGGDDIRITTLKPPKEYL